MSKERETVRDMDRFSEAVLSAVKAAEGAIETFGTAAQEMMVFEELGELSTALARRHRGRATDDMVVEEAADVLIMAIQIGILCGRGNIQTLTDVLEEKTHRLEQRLRAAREPA